MNAVKWISGKLSTIRVLAVSLMLMNACGGGGDNNEPISAGDWRAESDNIFTVVFVDPANDLEGNVPESPSYPISYPATDVTGVDLGIDGNYLYIKATFTDTIPSEIVSISASGDVEAQTVHQHDIGINLDIDNNGSTGAAGGIDIFFAVVFFYGNSTSVYANYNFSSTDIHEHQSSLEGELVGGGAGYKYAVLRYDISQLDSSYFPRGQTVVVSIWAEAESNLYHHYAYDPMPLQSWTIP